MTELSADALLKDGGFKTLVSTEEPIMIDPKWVKPFMYVSTAKHMIAANNLPVLRDRSGGTFNRLLIIPFERVIPDRDQDPYLRDKLRDEMPGILAWALAGAKRLIERQGRWPSPALSERMLKVYRNEQNSASYFIDECFVRDDTAAEMLAVITTEFNRWSHGQKTSNRKLAEMLRSHLGPRAIRKVRINGRSVRCLIGYRFSGQLRSATVAVDPEEAEMYDELDGGKLREHGSDSSAVGSAGANGGGGARDDGV
jgi:putative DNA primase/helicase